MHGVSLEAEGSFLRRFANNGSSGSLDEILPVKAFGRPRIAKPSFKMKKIQLHIAATEKLGELTIRPKLDAAVVRGNDWNSAVLTRYCRN